MQYTLEQPVYQETGFDEHFSMEGEIKDLAAKGLKCDSLEFYFGEHTSLQFGVQDSFQNFVQVYSQIKLCNKIQSVQNSVKISSTRFV